MLFVRRVRRHLHPRDRWPPASRARAVPPLPRQPPFPQVLLEAQRSRPTYAAHSRDLGPRDALLVARGLSEARRAGAHTLLLIAVPAVLAWGNVRGTLPIGELFRRGLAPPNGPGEVSLDALAACCRRLRRRAGDRAAAMRQGARPPAVAARQALRRRKSRPTRAHHAQVHFATVPRCIDSSVSADTLMLRAARGRLQPSPAGTAVPETPLHRRSACLPPRP